MLTALVAWAALAITGIWVAALPLAPAVAATLAVLFVSAWALRSQVFGGRRAGRILVWSSEGRWHYENPDGTVELLELSPVSRGFPGGALLVFQQTRSIRWALLMAGAHGSDELRRLRMRLNLDPPRSGNLQSAATI